MDNDFYTWLKSVYKTKTLGPIHWEHVWAKKGCPSASKTTLVYAAKLTITCGES